MPTQIHKKKHVIDERDAVEVLVRRARRKIPEFHAMEELNLVPYLDVMVNLIIFMMVTISSFLPLGILSIYPPASSASTGENEGTKTPEPENNFTVFIQNDGFVLAGAGGAMEPVTMKDGKYDYDKLSDKVVEIKKAFPKETKMIIAAAKEIRYEILIKVMDTVREKGEMRLFDNIQLSYGMPKTAQ